MRHAPLSWHDRYHVPPELLLVVLDEPGETLAPVVWTARAEGRAAFFDFTVDGRWGGIISGDRIRVDFGTCPCSTPGPTAFLQTSLRYSNMSNDDKITCAGTMDAYVRGLVEE